MAALARPAGHTDTATMGLDYMLDDSQAQTGASHLPGTRLIYPVESFKYAGKALGGMPMPVSATST